MGMGCLAFDGDGDGDTQRLLMGLMGRAVRNGQCGRSSKT